MQRSYIPNGIISHEMKTIIIGSDNTRGRGRPMLTLDVVVKNDMIRLNPSEHLVFDRAQWHKWIHVVDPN